MDNQSIQKALLYTKKNGVGSLTRAAFNFADFSQWPVLEPTIDSIYEDIVIDSSKLIKKYSTDWWELDEELDGLYPKLSEEIAPLQDDPNVEFNYWPRFSFKQPFVAEVPDVTVAGPDPIAITEDGNVLLDTTNSVNVGPDRRFGGAIKRAVSDSPTNVGTALLRGTAPEPNESESVAAIVHSYWDNYYHWMLEDLLKLRGIARYEDITGQDVTLVIPSNPKRYVTESLELLGYEEDDYVEWSGGPLDVDRLVVPSFPDLTPKTIEWMRNEITSGLYTGGYSGPDWVYVSRQAADTRRVVNYPEVESILREYDVQPVACEDLSLREEIQLFSNVDGIIGPHGAGLTASVWASEAHLVELFNGVVKAPYYVLADVLDHEYTALSTEPVGTAEKNRNKNMRINVRELESVLDRVTSQPSHSYRL